MKIMLDTARCFSYIHLHSRIGSPLPDIPFSNNSFEPIMKTTLGTVVYGVGRFGEYNQTDRKENLNYDNYTDGTIDGDQARAMIGRNIIPYQVSLGEFR
jgi:hypothetical protein